MSKGAYIGVGNSAKKIKNIYIGVNGVAKKVKKAYIGVNNVAKLWWSSGAAAIPKYTTSKSFNINENNDWQYNGGCKINDLAGRSFNGNTVCEFVSATSGRNDSVGLKVVFISDKNDVMHKVELENTWKGGSYNSSYIDSYNGPKCLVTTKAHAFLMSGGYINTTIERSSRTNIMIDSNYTVSKIADFSDELVDATSVSYSDHAFCVCGSIEDRKEYPDDPTCSYIVYDNGTFSTISPISGTSGSPGVYQYQSPKSIQFSNTFITGYNNEAFWNMTGPSYLVSSAGVILSTYTDGTVDCTSGVHGVLATDVAVVNFNTPQNGDGSYYDANFFSINSSGVRGTTIYTERWTKPGGSYTRPGLLDVRSVPSIPDGSMVYFIHLNPTGYMQSYDTNFMYTISNISNMVAGRTIAAHNNNIIVSSFDTSGFIVSFYLYSIM